MILSRHLWKDGGQCRRKRGPCHAEQYNLVRDVGKLDLGTQYEHTQALLNRRLQRAGHGHGVTGFSAPQQKGCQHASLGRAVTAVYAGILRQLLDVARQLIVQKIASVFARKMYKAEMREIGKHGSSGAG
jgi:hypothetical protein